MDSKQEKKTLYSMLNPQFAIVTYLTGSNCLTEYYNILWTSLLLLVQSFVGQ